METALFIALVLALVLLVAAGIGGGIYVIARPNRVVLDDPSPRWRPIMVVALRLAGVLMVGVALVVLYLSFWTVTCGPCSGE